jgi:type III secretory pathway component EscR
MDLNEMKKELFYEPKHAMETVDDTVVKTADDFCEGYKKYLDFAKIERESVEFFITEAEKKGYTEFDNTKKYNAGDNSLIFQKHSHLHSELFQ